MWFGAGGKSVFEIVNSSLFLGLGEMVE